MSTTIPYISPPTFRVAPSYPTGSEVQKSLIRDSDSRQLALVSLSSTPKCWTLTGCLWRTSNPKYHRLGEIGSNRTPQFSVDIQEPGSPNLSTCAPSRLPGRWGSLHTCRRVCLGTPRSSASAHLPLPHHRRGFFYPTSLPPHPPRWPLSEWSQPKPQTLSLWSLLLKERWPCAQTIAQ